MIPTLSENLGGALANKLKDVQINNLKIITVEVENNNNIMKILLLIFLLKRMRVSKVMKDLLLIVIHLCFGHQNLKIILMRF